MEGDNVAAIRKQQYYVKYGFMPSPDGGFYDMGFGSLVGNIGEAINTLLNQMLDAGRQSVVQGGFVSSQMGIKEKKVSIKPGEFRVINASGDIRTMVLPMNFPGPSPVLFELLGLMIDAAKDITGVKDVLTGEGQGKNASPTTTMALIEQGLQQFTAIYKRIHRALKKEYGILAGLNKKHVDPQVYADFFDEGQAQQGVDPAAQQPGMPAAPQGAMPQGLGAPGQGMQPQQASLDPKADFNEQDMDILPVSDPAMVTSMQKMAQADFVMQTARENPAVDAGEATKRAFEAARVEKVDELIHPPPQPDPKVIELTQRGAEAEVAKVENEAKNAAADAELKQAQTQVLLAKTHADIELLGAKVESEQAKVEESASRLFMDHHTSQQPEPVEDTGPTPFEVQQHEDEMAQRAVEHDDKMALEAAKVASSHQIGMKPAPRAKA
jgi:chaperonin GroES